MAFKTNRAGGLAFILAASALVGFSIWSDNQSSQSQRVQAPVVDRSWTPPERLNVVPDWARIAAWPPVEAEVTDATPDPNRRVTTIVLDDSGSMRNDLDAAKAAVTTSLRAMADTDRVAVVALNRGVVLPFMSVADARDTIAGALARVPAQGGTPLTGAVLRAQEMLEAEAAAARAYGTYRMIVTTDGAADDGRGLTRAISNLARDTPIQLATIGIAVSRDHVLRKPEVAQFLDVDNVAGLGRALESAVAENRAFDPITSFDGDN